MLDLYHVTTLSNFARGYDKYTRQYSKKDIPESNFPEQFFVLKKEELSIGVAKGKRLLEKLNLMGDRLIVLQTEFNLSQLSKDHESRIGQYVDQNFIRLSDVYFIDLYSLTKHLTLEIVSVEEMVAKSLKVLDSKLLPWKNLEPRTFSILPVAKACQADCKFCFSKASVSVDFSKVFKEWDTLSFVMKMAKEHGATRSVITGGGEPTLLKS